MLDIDYHGATGGLIRITGGSDLTLQDAEGIASESPVTSSTPMPM